MSDVNPVPVPNTVQHVPTATADPVAQFTEDTTAAVAAAAAAQSLPQVRETGVMSVGVSAQAGGIKRLHGFSVTEPSIEDAASDAAALAALTVTPKKAGKLVSLPGSSEAALLGSIQRSNEKLRAGGMRVVLPEQSGAEVAASPAQQTSRGQGQGSPPTAPLPPSYVEGTMLKQAMSCIDGRPLATAAASPARETPAAPPPPPAAAPTAPGRVVEPGQEHTGRWTKEEHEAFLSALQMYGKEWKKVAARVKTRTVVQTRTHAQKYFQKLQKVMKTSDGTSDVGAVEMGTASSAKKATPPSVQKKKDMVRRKTGGMALPNTLISQQQRQVSQGANAAAQAAAQLMAQMATSQPHVPSPALSAGSQQLGMTSSSSPYVAAGPALAQGDYSSSQVYSTSATTADGQLQSHVPESYSTDQYSGSASYGAAPVAPPIARGAMKIVAPPPDQTMKRGFFPEPSPAACGKRKLAEIAAAQMLAGVAAASGGSAISMAQPPLPPPVAQQQQQQQQHQPPQPLPSLSVKGYIDSLSGQATPPPDGGIATDGTIVPPVQKPANANGGMGFSLQIVNPDTLDDGDHGGKRRRVMNSQASPSTPWDGELAALVSEVKSKGTEQSIQGFGGIENEISGPPLLGEAFTEEAPAPPLHPLLETTSRSDLHKAVCTESIETVAVALSVSNIEPFVNQCDGDGFFPLHSAAAIGIAEGSPTTESIKNAEEIVHLLLSSGAEACCCDSKGNTPLHWAARAGSDKVCHTLIMRNCPLDAPNESGETALHWAMRSGVLGLEAVRVLLQNGARASAFNNDFNRPLDVAAEGFSHLLTEKPAKEGAPKTAGGTITTKGTATDRDKTSALTDSVLAKERQQSRANFFSYSSQSRTLVLHHPDCLDHIPKSSHDWECPDRVQCIMDRIIKETGQDNLSDDDTNIQPNEVVISTDFDRAPLELLSRIHSATYLAFVNDLSKELERRKKKQLVEATESNDSVDPSVVPFTPMVQRTILRGSSVKKGTHSDTSFSAGSLKAARRAAGAVQHAVDRVLIGRNRNAFCVVRPPGHHAGVNGLLAGGESCGFCIFNSVAAGAMHALSDESHRPRCERCAIVDIDVHHGNGTEEIVRKCHDPGRLLFFSVHLFDQEKTTKKISDNYKFYPGTGDKDDVAHNIINVPIAPLWRDRGVTKNTSSASGTLSAPVESHHNTRLKKKRQAAAAAAASSKSSSPRDSIVEGVSETGDKPTVNTKDNISDVETSSVDDSASRSSKTSGQKRSSAPSSPQSPHYQTGLGRHSYRRAVQQRLLPALRAFNPDLILLSTGFDASRGDVGNARHYAGGRERMGLDLEPEDYAWTTQKIIEIADICCQGRVVSVLEGGYGRTPTPEVSPENSDSKGSHLDRTAFAECAMQHIRALIDPAQVLKRTSSDV